MKYTKFNDDWKFWEIKNSFALNWAPPEEAVTVELPHDAMIENPQDPDSRSGANSGYRKGGVYSYSKTFFADDPAKTFILKIEGAYMNAFVYVNGQLAAKRPFGYTVFYVPLNKYLEYGKENEIRIQVRSGAEPNSRWYPGTGLYRDVYMLEAGPSYIKPDSVRISTVSIPESLLKAPSEGTAAVSGTSDYETILKNIFNTDAALQPSAEEGEKPSLTDLYKSNLQEGKPAAAGTLNPQAAKESAGVFTVKAELPKPGTYIPGSFGSSCAAVKVNAVIVSRNGENPGTVEITITDPSGRTAASSVVRLKDPVPADPGASGKGSGFFMDSPEFGEEIRYEVDALLPVPDPQLWDDRNPVLYTCTLSLLSAAGTAADSHGDTFGIRILSVSPTEGFRVNGKEVKLRGACIHHDSGLLGSKTYDEFHLRQIRILKESGFNAIRCAHNPAAPALLRACDKLGMYVMDEAFDIWTRHKSDYDYGLYFEEWWEADVEAMVSNAFNHPSVIMYSIGNEIPEIGTPLGVQITKALCEKIKSLDGTRFTTASVNGIFSVGDKLGQIVSDVAKDLASQGKHDGNVNDFMAFMHSYMNDMTRHSIVDEIISAPFEYTDIAGYNYMGSRYDIENALHPDRVITGSETGIGDLCYNWERVKKYPYVIGDFCWTGWEYLGEAGIGMPNYSNGSNPFGVASFPLQISGTGCIDITGHRLPMSYYREIVFGLRKDPYIAVQDPAHYGENLIRNPWIISDAIGSWSWTDYDGKPVIIEVYSDSDEVELFKDGVSLGRKSAGYANNCMAFFETTYEPGTLTAVSYSAAQDETQEMIETGRFEISSAGSSIHLEAVADAPETACPCDAVHEEAAIRFINISLCDEKGILAADRFCELKYEINGAARVLGFGSADPWPVHNYTDDTACTWQGRAQMIVKKEDPGQSVAITFTANNGLACTVEI